MRMMRICTVIAGLVVAFAVLGAASATAAEPVSDKDGCIMMRDQ
ncbi:hypothetical protein [Streptomyces sp. H51]|nr:hypothetical protein [Streptomyces sp. H51]